MQSISWVIIKRLTESESVLPKRGIEANFGSIVGLVCIHFIVIFIVSFFFNSQFLHGCNYWRLLEILSVIFQRLISLLIKICNDQWYIYQYDPVKASVI